MHRSDAPVALRWGLPALVAVLTVLCFLPALDNRFVNWDDDRNFLENRSYRGLGLQQLRWMFTTFHMGLYQPLSWLTLGFDYTVWGLNPLGYHLTNVVLQTMSGVAFYFLAVALLRRAASVDGGVGLRLAAAGGALFFAIHPLRVESVAWATERRDPLSGLFYILTVLAYLRAHPTEGATRSGWLAASVACYALSLLSKALGMTLPAVLVALDVYPLRRLATTRIRTLLLEKLPYVALSLAAAAVAFRAAQSGGTFRPFAEHGLAARAAQVAYTACFYPLKTLLPLWLSPLYLLEQPLDPARPKYVGALLLVVAVTAGLYTMRRRWPWVLTAWVCYLITAAPVLGLAQNGRQAAADRYSYLPCLAFAMLVAGGLHRLWAIGQRDSRARYAALSAMVIGVIMLGRLTSSQTHVWKDARTLWNHALRVDPQNYIAYVNRGWDHEEKGELIPAFKDYDEALRVNPRCELAHNNRGSVRYRLHDLDGAIADFSEAIRLNPNYVNAYINRGSAWWAKGDLSQAVDDYSAALRVEPRSVLGYLNRGHARAARGARDDAIADYRQALELAQPDSSLRAAAARALGTLESGSPAAGSE